jgi:hypothetical protein
VIIDDLNVVRATVAPDEADSPLLIDSYAVLSLSVSHESFQAVSRRDTEVFNAHTAIQHPQFPKGRLLKVGRQPARILTLKDPLRLSTPEALYHPYSI